MPNAPNSPELELFFQLSDGSYKYAASPTYAVTASTQAVYAGAENGGVEVQPGGVPVTLNPVIPPSTASTESIPVLSTLNLMGVSRVEGSLPSEADGQVVIHEQLVSFEQAVDQSIAQLTQVLGTKITGPEATTIATQIVTAAVAGLQNAQQVQTAIGLAIASLDEVLSIPVKRVFSGSLANIVTTDLVPGDGNLEGLATSGVLVQSPNVGESGIYYLNQSGNLVNYTESLIEQGLEVGTWIWAEVADGETLAYRVIDITPFTARAVAAPAAYSDEITNGVHVDPVTRKIFLSVDPDQFAFDAQRRLVLASAIKAAIDMVPLLEDEVSAQALQLSTLQTQVAAQAAAAVLLANRVMAVESENGIQAQTLITQAQVQQTQAGQIQGLDTRTTALETGKVDKSSVRSNVLFNVVNGVPQNLDGSACSFVLLAAGSTISKGLYDVTHNLGWMPQVQVVALNENGHPMHEAIANTWSESETVRRVAIPKSGSYRVQLAGSTGGVFF
jgi:hypothetical protein